MKQISGGSILLKNYNTLLTITFLLTFISGAVCSPKDTPAPAPAKGGSGIDMHRVFTNGILGCLFGAAVIGGANTVVILMGDNTKSNFYRVKYGFAVGTMVGLLYGTITGVMGIPLVPAADKSATPAKSFNRSIHYALSNLQIGKEGNNVFIFTRLYRKTF